MSITPFATSDKRPTKVPAPRVTSPSAYPTLPMASIFVLRELNRLFIVSMYHLEKVLVVLLQME